MTTTASPPLSAPAPDVTPTRDAVEPAGAFDARLRGIDGLRAIAVIVVVLYHLTPGTTDGGYLGVDIFFVISGFLITGLLLKERERTGHVRLRSFWARRARRLLPPLVLTVLVCTSAALVIGGDVLVGIGRQLLGAATFSFNWIEIVEGSSYFVDATPELFRNFWSLAVEEQFYLIWPFVVLAVALVPRARVRVVIVLLLAGASALAMVSLYTPDSDSTRVYYGTDTHSFGLAIGAALAFLVAARPPATWSAAVRRLLGGCGALSLAALLALAILMTADAEAVYRGGLVAVAVLTAIVIAACIAPGSLLGRALDLAPIRWVGQRSYGIYLWHWPVVVLFAAALPQFTQDPLGLWLLGGAAAIVTIVAATLSFRFVESPIRRWGFRATGRRIAARARAGRRAATRVALVAVAATAVVSMTGFAVLVAPSRGALEQTVAVGQQAIEQQNDLDPPPAPPAELPTVAEPGAVGEQAAAPTDPAAPPATGLAGIPTGDQITAIGDSVMVAVAPQLQKAYPGISIHAKVSRQLSEAPAILEKIAKRGDLRPVLLVGLGTNGPITQKQLDRLVHVAGAESHIVLVNVQAPRRWVKANNRLLAATAAKYRNVELADWRTPIREQLTLLYADKIHAKKAKAGRIYATAVTDAFARLVAAPPAPTIDLGLFQRAGG